MNICDKNAIKQRIFKLLKYSYLCKFRIKNSRKIKIILKFTCKTYMHAYCFNYE